MLPDYETRPENQRYGWGDVRNVLITVMPANCWREADLGLRFSDLQRILSVPHRNCQPA